MTGKSLKVKKRGKGVFRRMHVTAFNASPRFDSEVCGRSANSFSPRFDTGKYTKLSYAIFTAAKTDTDVVIHNNFLLSNSPHSTPEIRK